MSRVIPSYSLCDCTMAVDNAANILNGFPAHLATKDATRARAGAPPARPPSGARSVTVSRHDPYRLRLLRSPCAPLDGFLASYSDGEAVPPLALVPAPSPLSPLPSAASSGGAEGWRPAPEAPAHGRVLRFTVDRSNGRPVPVAKIA